MCFLDLFLLVFLYLILPAERRRILKNKKEKLKKLDQVLTQKKAIFGPSFDSTAYIYVVGSIIGPHLTLCWVNSWAIVSCFFCLFLLLLCRENEIFEKKAKLQKHF